MKKFRKFLKNIGKTNSVRRMIAFIAFIYLKIIQISCKIIYEFEGELEIKDFPILQKHSIITWHKNIFIGSVSILTGTNKPRSSHILVSPSEDGFILSNVLSWLGYKVIEGSTNKNSTQAIKAIFNVLDNDENIIITPDGPRGPAEEINSSITSIIYKKDASIIPICFKCSNYKELNSWDKMIIPLPFSTITVLIKPIIKPTGNETRDKQLLKKALSSYTQQN